MPPKSSTGLTCSTLPDNSAALPEARKRRGGHLGTHRQSALRSRSPRRLSGQSRPEPGGGAALFLLALFLLALFLWERDQRVLYPSTSLASAWIVPATTPTAASPTPMPAMCSLIADQARMRGDLGKLS